MSTMVQCELREMTPFHQHQPYLSDFSDLSSNGVIPHPVNELCNQFASVADPKKHLTGFIIRMASKGLLAVYK